MTPRFPAARQATRAPRRRAPRPIVRIPLGLWLKLIGYAFVVYLGAAVAVPAIVAIIARHH